MADLRHRTWNTSRHQQCDGGSLCGLAAACLVRLVLAGLYECRSRDLLAERCDTSTLSLETLQADRANSCPLSKCRATVEAGKRVPLVAVLWYLSFLKNCYSHKS